MRILKLRYSWKKQMSVGDPVIPSISPIVLIVAQWMPGEASFHHRFCRVYRLCISSQTSFHRRFCRMFTWANTVPSPSPILLTVIQCMPCQTPFHRHRQFCQESCNVCFVKHLFIDVANFVKSPTVYVLPNTFPPLSLILWSIVEVCFAKHSSIASVVDWHSMWFAKTSTHHRFCPMSHSVYMAKHWSISDFAECHRVYAWTNTLPFPTLPRVVQCVPGQTQRHSTRHLRQ